MQQSIRERAAMRALTEAPTQVTGAIRPVKIVRLVHTENLPAVEQPSASKIVHIGSILVPLLHLTAMSEQRVLQGYRLAYLNQRLQFKDAIYVIRNVYLEAQTGKIYARLEREGA